MDADKKTLLCLINNASKEIADILIENELQECEDIQALCYEALSELYPGGGRKIVQRSKVWKVIQASLKDDKVDRPCIPLSSRPSTPLSSRPSTPLSSRSSTPSSSRSGLSSPISDDDDAVTFLTNQPSPALIPLATNMVSSVASALPHSMHPQFSLYSDPAIQAARLEGKMDKKLRERLVRGTMDIMVSASSVAPFSRFPTRLEIEEMAKSLIMTYPCLKDAETGHGVIFNALKRRLSNTKPVIKPQGPCEKKRKYASSQENKPDPADGTIEIPEEKLDEVKNSDEEASDKSDIDGMEVMSRHYKCLSKEMDKKRSNMDVVNAYLNKEFVARREWMCALNADERVEKLLKEYPCFKDHVEVIEEARRVLQIESGGKREDFKSDLLQKLNDEVESLIYFGMNSKGLNPPKSYKQDYKIMYVFLHLSTMFASKQRTSKKPVELVHQLKDHEDVDAWCMKRNGNVPILLVSDDSCYLIVGRSILCKIKMLNEAVLALMSSFYLLDYDYPKQQEIGLSILQYYLFNDKDVPQDIVMQFEATLASYKKFRN